VNLGAASKPPVNAPATDIDGNTRPPGFDAGADELPGPTVVAFPATTVLDPFNRANASNLGTDWTSPSPGFRVNTSTLEIRGSAVAPELWTGLFGPNQEAYFTFNDVSTLASSQGLVLKHTSATSMIRVLYHRAAGTVTVETGNAVTPLLTIPAVSFVNGDTLGARVEGETVTVFRNGTQIGTTTAAGYTGGGQIGVWFAGTTNTTAGNARIDNFGGGSL
jgi:hypothetical protein